MFKFLKEKIKGAVSKLSKDIDEQAEDVEEQTEEVLEEVTDEPKEVKETPKVKKESKKDTSKPKEEPKAEEKKKVQPEKKEDLKKEEPKEEKQEDNSENLTEIEKKLAADFEKDKKEEPVEEPKTEEKKVEEKGFLGKLKDKFTKKEEKEKPEEILDIPEERPVGESKPEDIALPKEIKEAEKEEEKLQGPKKEQSVEKDLPEPPAVESIEEEKPETPKPKVEEKEPEKEVKKGFFSKITDTITKKKISESKFDELFWDMEVALLENNVAVEVIEKIKSDLKVKIVDQKLARGKIEEEIMNSLGASIAQLFEVETFDLISKVKDKKPYVIAFVGVNGSGKTTTIAKMVDLFKKNKITCVVAAADTFRAAAIQQLEEHTDKLGVKLIKHDYGADPAAVAYDAIEHAKAKDIDVVFIDTAGRLHSNSNLMDEMKKIIRVAKPDMKIFIGESITGNDCVEQAKQFDEAIGIDAMILSKADVDEKGGAAISVSYVTGKPILYIGTGQEYCDLKRFDKSIVLDTLGI